MSERGAGFDRPLPAKGGVGGEKGEVRGFTGARRTGRCPKSRSGWPVVAARREQAVGGGGNSSAGCSGGTGRRGWSR